jgi:hypothetical protein
MNYILSQALNNSKNMYALSGGNSKKLHRLIFAETSRYNVVHCTTETEECVRDKQKKKKTTENEASYSRLSTSSWIKRPRLCKHTR